PARDRFQYMPAALLESAFAACGIGVASLDLFKLVLKKRTRVFLLFFYSAGVRGVLAIRFYFPILCIARTFGLSKRVARLSISQQYSLFVRRAITPGLRIPQRDDLPRVELIAREVFFGALRLTLQVEYLLEEFDKTAKLLSCTISTVLVGTGIQAFHAIPNLLRGGNATQVLRYLFPCEHLREGFSWHVNACGAERRGGGVIVDR